MPRRSIIQLSGHADSLSYSAQRSSEPAWWAERQLLVYLNYMEESGKVVVLSEQYCLNARWK